MKTKKLERKFNLNKHTVADLELKNVRGGGFSNGADSCNAVCQSLQTDLVECRTLVSECPSIEIC